MNRKYISICGLTNIDLFPLRTCTLQTKTQKIERLQQLPSRLLQLFISNWFTLLNTVQSIYFLNWTTYEFSFLGPTIECYNYPAGHTSNSRNHCRIISCSSKGNVQVHSYSLTFILSVSMFVFTPNIYCSRFNCAYSLQYSLEILSSRPPLILKCVGLCSNRKHR